MNKIIGSQNLSANKTFLACLIAPWAVIPSLLLISLFTHSAGVAQIFEMIVLLGIFGVPIAYMATIIIGLPTHILLRLIGNNKVYPYPLSGALAVIIFSFTTYQVSLESMMFLLCAVTVATTFGYMVKERG